MTPVRAGLPIARIVRSPYTYVLVAVYAGSGLLLASYTGEPPGERLAGLILFAVLAALMIACTMGVPTGRIEIRAPGREARLAVAWLAVWLALNLALWPSFFGASAWASNGVSFWLMLVVLPALWMRSRGYRPADAGLSRRDFTGNLRATLLACLGVGGALLWLTPGGRLLRTGSFATSTLLYALGASFGLALIGAAIHEEFFFRAVLQTRLARAVRSEVGGLVLATLCFCAYHFPFHFYGELATGDLGYALGLTFTDAVFGGLVLGVLWLRTHNLLAPVVVHALVDAISLMPRLLTPG